MPSIRLEDLSPFGRVALELDGHMSELVRLSGQLQNLDIESEGGLARAVKLLGEFERHAKNISEGIQGFAKVLEDARARAETAARLVGEHAQPIQQRIQQQNELREKLNQVEEKVKAASAGIAGFRNNGKSAPTDEEKRRIRTELVRLNEDLKKFLEDVQSIKENAGQLKFKAIEHDAKTLLEALKASSRKIEKSTGENA